MLRYGGHIAVDNLQEALPTAWAKGLRVLIAALLFGFFVLTLRSNQVATGLALTLLGTTGCAVQRGQESVGSYVDDSAITLAVKSRFVESKEVDAAAISVETLNGTVMLSGFAKSSAEKTAAEQLAWQVKGVKAVKNEIAIRP